MSGAGAVVARSARFRAPHDIRVESVEMRAPEAGQVRVRLEGCGVCDSNLPEWEGRSWFNYPLEAAVCCRIPCNQLGVRFVMYRKPGAR
jgi:threonine dehydrogenase-like Zn-dependent dehydrogenase